MRAGGLAAILAAVLLASALNLVLGGLWVLTWMGLLLLGRRVRGAVFWVLLATVAVGVALGWLGALGPPAPASYAEDEAAWLERHVLRVAGPTGGGSSLPLSREAVIRARLDERRREELRYDSGELERRAALAVASALEARRLRDRAPAEMAALDDAVRQLALTVTAPEFRDLDARRARVVRWLDELEIRVRMARDPAELSAAARALEPAAMAPVSFRALHEDLARVNQATRALVRKVAGGDVGVTARVRIEYDEARGALVVEHRYAVGADGSLRIRRVDAEPLRRRATRAGDTQQLAYRVGSGEPRELPGGAEVAVEPPAERVEVTDRRLRPATVAPVRAALRPIPFQRLRVAAAAGAPPELAVGLALGGAAAPGAAVWVEPTPARLDGIALPRHAFHVSDAPGALEEGGDRDVWVPASGSDLSAGSGAISLELRPRTAILRNGIFARLRTYLYTPNPAALLAVVGLAAGALLLGHRPRVTGPPAAPGPGG